MRAQLLWDVLTDTYGRLGFEAVRDETFKALVCARVVEPTSKTVTLRVLADLGVTSLQLVSLHAGIDFPHAALAGRVRRTRRPTGSAAHTETESVITSLDSDRAPPTRSPPPCATTG